MRSTHLHRAPLLIGLVALWLAPHRARACDTWPSCMMLFEDPDEVFASAGVVFRGRLLEHHPSDPPDIIFEIPLVYDLFYSTASAEFEIQEAWKGVETRHVTIYTEAHGCYGDLLRHEPGTDLLVFAREDPEGGRGMWVDICYRALPVEHEWAQQALVYLGPGERDLPVRTSSKWLVIGVIGVVVVVGTALPLAWWRRSRRERSEAR